MTDSEFDDLLDDAQNLTHQQLSTEIAALTTLTREQIAAMAPSVDNMVELLRFIQIVRSAANFNDKKAILLANIDIFAKFVFSIAGAVVGSAKP